MKQIALIDGDIVGYRCAATCNDLDLDIAHIRINDLMHRILHETDAVNYKVYLTGSNNFRYEIYPEYKANRKDKPRPKWLQECREFLVTEWKAKVTDGNEADDELGIDQTGHGLDSVICSIDKDLLQIPGYHYDFVKGLERFVSTIDGNRTFYAQLIAGDGSDNIPSFDGNLRSGIPKFIQKLQQPLNEMTEASDMYKYVCKVYEDKFGNPLGWKHLEQIIRRNARCLWIQRKENDQWEAPVNYA